jgi:hypothetical protein
MLVSFSQTGANMAILRDLRTYSIGRDSPAVNNLSIGGVWQFWRLQSEPVYNASKSHPGEAAMWNIEIEYCAE